MARIWIALWLFGAAGALAQDSVVIRGSTSEALVDGSALPKGAIGIWRLDVGSTVESTDGFVELEIGDAGWLRLRHHTAVKLVVDDDATVVLEFEKGAAVLDMLDKRASGPIELRLGSATLEVREKGSFLAEAAPSRFAVLKGKAGVRMGGQAQTLKTKTSIPADGSGAAQKLDKLDKDEFEKWRHARHNQKIRERALEADFAERVMRPAK